MEDLSIEDLQKLKLQAEIKALEKPFYKRIEFLTFASTSIIAIASTCILFVSINFKTQQDKIDIFNKQMELNVDKMQSLTDKNLYNMDTVFQHYKVLGVISNEAKKQKKRADSLQTILNKSQNK